LFQAAGLSSPFAIPYLAGYFFLLFVVSYQALFTRQRSFAFLYVVLGAIGLNFLVQITGGPSSLLRPLYVLAGAAAVFLPPLEAAAGAALVIAVDGVNLLISGTFGASWRSFAGQSIAVAGLVAVIAPAAARLRLKALAASERYRKLISAARSVDPLADTTPLEALTQERMAAANVSTAVERENAFRGLIGVIYGIVPAYTYALFLADRDAGAGVYTLQAIRSEGYFAAQPGTRQATRAGGLIGICISRNEPQYLPDVVIPGKNLGYYAQDVPVKSFLAIPISRGETVDGVLVVDSLEHDAFGPENQDLLVRFAPFFRQIIEKTRISQELDRRARVAAALHEMSTVLSSGFEIDVILAKLAERIGMVVPSEYRAFLLYREDTGEAEVTAATGFAGDVVGKRFVANDSGMLKQMIGQWATQQAAGPYDFPDLGKRGRDVGFFPLRELQEPLKGSIHSFYCQPLVAQEKFIGAFVIASRTARAFLPYQKDFIGTLMNQTAVVIDNAALHGRIMDLARTDGLTGLLNHRTFMDKLDEEFRRIDRNRDAFSMLLLDIDHFKKVNDTHGHPAGDAALKGVASVVRDMARKVDFVARYGGEEFAVGMVGAGSDGARQMAERIRTMVEATPVAAGRAVLRMTVSIGVASIFPGCERKEELIARADQALYYAKQTGRNRVSLYEKMPAGDSVPLRR
jgi:diguanylate cyclase (GGDEF)-like protein